MGREKQKEADLWLKKMNEEYKEMSPEALYTRMEMQDTDTLKWICSDIALPEEHYELCQVAKEILEKRGEELDN